MRIPEAVFVVVVAGSMANPACMTDPSKGPDRRTIASDFGLSYSPLFAAFEPDHEYRVPISAQAGVTVDDWEIVDADGQVLEDVADVSSDTGPADTVLTLRKPGDYFVLAHAGALTGCAELHVADGTPESWAAGDSRYNKLVYHPVFIPSADSGPRLPMEMSCKECHGDGANFVAAVPRPQRTAGYSDEALIDLFTRGIKPTPPSADAPSRCKPYAWEIDETPVPVSLFTYFHTWDATDEDKAGLVQYLRAIAPRSAADMR